MQDVARHPRDISKIAGICCDTVCATLCSVTGISAKVCVCATKLIFLLEVLDAIVL